MNKKGFTLVELVVTISIFSILATISIPGYISWLPKHKLQTSVRQIYDDMNLAKLWAVRSNSNVYITVDSVNENYTIFIDSNADGVYTPGTDTRLRNNATLEDGVNIIATTFKGNQFIFNNRASAATTTINPGQNNYEVRLTSPSNLYLGVRVNIAGGISTIQSTDNGATWTVQ